MDVWTIVAVIFAGGALFWSIFRDKSGDNKELTGRVSTLESKVLLQESTLSRLEEEQDEMKETLKSLGTQIHQLDLKIERILTILEKVK